MKLNSHKGLYLKMALIVGTILVACKEDIELASNKGANQASDVVTFGITYKQGWTPDVVGRNAEVESVEEVRNRGTIRTKSLSMDCEQGKLKEDIQICMIEEDYVPTEPLDDDAPKSRTEDGGEQTVVEPKYGIFAYHATGVAEFPIYNTAVEGVTIKSFEGMSNMPLTDRGETTDGKIHYWPGTGWLQFFAYTPYISSNQSQTSAEEESGVNVTSSYSISQSQNGFSPILTYTAGHDIVNHKPFAVGAVEQPMKGDGLYKSEVEITLKNILSKVQFKLGNKACGTIKSISIEGFKYTGTYNFKDKTWDLEDNEISYIQEASENNVLTIDEEDVIGLPMYLLPQTFDDESNPIIKVVIHVNPGNGGYLKPVEGEDFIPYTLTKPLKDLLKDIDNNCGFKSDKQYTFVISTPSEIQLSVEDKVEENVKSDLVITNTGLAPVWIRALIHGEWVVETTDEKNVTTKNIVGIWDENNDGTFTGLNETVWKRPENDNHYYYMKELKRGETAVKLFDSYTLTANPPEPGAFLELTIVVQAYDKNDINTLWPKDAVAQIEN